MGYIRPKQNVKELIQEHDDRLDELERRTRGESFENETMRFALYIGFGILGIVLTRRERKAREKASSLAKREAASDEVADLMDEILKKHKEVD